MAPGFDGRRAALYLASWLVVGCGTAGGGGGGGGGGGATGCGAYANALFCDDFESGQPLTTNWQATMSEDFSFPTLEHSATAYSPAHDMLAVAQVGDGGETFCSAMHSITPSSGAPLRVAFSFRVQVNDAVIDGVPHMLQLDAYPVGGSGGFEAQINLYGGQINFELVDFSRQDSAGLNGQTMGQYHLGEWSRVELSLDFMSQRVSAVVAGQSLPPFMYVPSPPYYAGGYRLDLYLIASALNGPSANTVEFDDVVIQPGP